MEIEERYRISCIQQKGRTKLSRRRQGVDRVRFVSQWKSKKDIEYPGFKKGSHKTVAVSARRRSSSICKSMKTEERYRISWIQEKNRTKLSCRQQSVDRWKIVSMIQL